jgi:hypothetical protein
MNQNNDEASSGSLWDELYHKKKAASNEAAGYHFKDWRNEGLEE